MSAAGLRAVMLDAWAASHTRLREDAEAEADLRRIGYRDRLFSELVQNAADAATDAGISGAVRIFTDPGAPGRGAPDRGEGAPTRLHVANTGAPLDEAGLEALCALRASDKKLPAAGTADGAGIQGRVGRFGVGFTAATTVSDELEIRSRGVSAAFSAERTRAAVQLRGIPIPEAGVPVLRLPWECAGSTQRTTVPARGWDTEVVLTLRTGVDVDALLRAAAGQAPELMLAFPGIERIEVEDGAGTFVWRRKESAAGVDGTLTRISTGHEEFCEYRAGQARWIVPLGPDGTARPVDGGVLHAPTRSDEELTLPAILIADVPMAPDRRRIMPGTDVSPLADAYPGLVAGLSEEQRTPMVPRPGFPRSEVDDALRRAVLRALGEQRWVPAAGGDALRGAETLVLPGLTEELAGILAGAVGGLAAADVSGPASSAALVSAGARRLDLAGLVDIVSGIDRTPTWWGRLYDALESLVDRGAATEALEALGALPVPLADGRMVTGPRTVVIGEWLTAELEDPELDCPKTDYPKTAAALTWARLAHPAAARPLLARLGAREATAAELLDDPALADLIARTDELMFTLAADAPDAAEAIGAPDPIRLAEAVLYLAEHSHGAAPRTDARGAPQWISGLLLPDADGELRPADELLLPDSPLAEVLERPSPFGTVARELCDAHPPGPGGTGALCAVGVGWGFTLVHEELPTRPHPDLDDADRWWSGLPEEPAELAAVRDLDLVAPEAWPRALEIMLAEPRIRPLLVDRDGYTAWWLRTHAEYRGRMLCTYAGDGCAYGELLDPLEHPEAYALGGILAQDRVDSAPLAAALLEALADRGRRVRPGTAARAHRDVIDAAADGRVDPEALPQPAGVRVLNGDVVGQADAVVADLPWTAQLFDDARTVPTGALDADSCADLADILGCPLASDTVDAVVVSVGSESMWDAEPGAVRAAALQGGELPAGRLVVHDQLLVRALGPESVGAGNGVRRVGWWIDAAGTVHVDGGAWPVPLTRLRGIQEGQRGGPD